MTQSVAVREDQNIVAVEATSIMDVIAKAAADPNTDVGKLERLLAMYERITAQRAKAAYTAALVAVKPELPVIDRRGRIEITDKATHTRVIQSTPYALWEDIDEAITPALNKHGLVLTFRSGVAQDGKITVTGVLSHKDGHTEETTITLPHDSSGSKNAVQAVGSSTSYGKRYTATLLLNIRTRGEDDDGDKGGSNTITDEQVQTIFDIIKRTKADTAKFCKYMGVEAVPDIAKKDYEKAIIALNTIATKKTAMHEVSIAP
jgi:hypothetical protein